MEKIVFLAKLVFVAITGFLFAAILVIIFNWGTTSSNKQFCDIEYLCAGIAYRHAGNPPKLADSLRERAKWLYFAQMEVDKLPLLLLASCLGPSLLIIQRQRRKKDLTSNET